MNVQVRDTPLGGTVAARLKKARENARYTRAQLFDLTGIPVKSIEKFETGDLEPSISRLMTLCETLGVSVDEILGSKSSSPPARQAPEQNEEPAAADPVLDYLTRLDDLRSDGFRNSKREAMALADQLITELHFVEPADLIDLAKQRGVQMDNCPSRLDLENAMAKSAADGQAACAEVEQRIIDTAVLGTDLFKLPLETLTRLADQFEIESPFWGWSEESRPKLVAAVRDPLRQLAATGKGIDLGAEDRAPARS